jgi:hypothetical protein
MWLNFRCWPEAPVRGAAAIQPLSVVRTCLRWRRLERKCCGSRLCIAASDTMWFVRGGKQRSSSTEIIPDGKLLAILAT